MCPANFGQAKSTKSHHGRGERNGKTIPVLLVFGNDHEVALTSDSQADLHMNWWLPKGDLKVKSLL